MHRVLLVLAFISFVSPVAFGQWEHLDGPATGGGGSYATLTHDKSFILTVSCDGIFKSIDTGHTWTHAALRDTIIRQVLCVPTTSRDIFIAYGVGIEQHRATYYHLFRSIDTGKTWTMLNQVDSTSLACVGLVHDTLIEFYDNYLDSIWVSMSTDQGTTWRFLPNPPTRRQSGAPDYMVSCNKYLFVYFYGRYFIRWSAQGWDTMHFLPNREPLGMAATGDTLFATTTGGVATSTDFGVHWRMMSNRGFDSSLTLQELTCHYQTLVVGSGFTAYASTDGGESWQSIEGKNGFPMADVVRPTGSLHYLAGSFWVNSPSGIYRSYDGINWQRSNTGIAEGYIWSLAVAENALHATTENGLYHSTDHGMTWSELHGAIDLEDSGAWYLQSQNGYLHPSGNGFWLKREGAGWFNPSGRDIECLGFDSGVWYGSLGWNGVGMSTDGGYTWTDISGNLPIFSNYTTTIVPAFGRVTAFMSDGSVYNTSDKGAHWKLLSWKSPCGGYQYAVTSSGIFVSSCGGLLCSRDQGETWTVDTSMSGYTIALSLFNGGIVVGNLDDYWKRQGLYYSSDGITWSSLNFPLYGIMSFATDDKFAYAATSTRGIWRRSLASLGVQSKQVAREESLNIYPNPSADKSTLSFSFAQRGHVSAQLYDACGILWQVAFDGEREAGESNITVDTHALPNGIYEVVVTSGSLCIAKRIAIER